jgi:hypothetical protein
MEPEIVLYQQFRDNKKLLSMYRLVLTVLFFLFSSYVMGQRKCNIPFPEGYLILLQPYEFKFDTAFKGYATFNDSILTRTDNSFQLTATENGIMRIYGINNLNDTTLEKEIALKFRDPNFTVFFDGKNSGGTINKQRLDRSSIIVEVPNIDIALHIPVVNVKAIYYSDDMVKTKEFRGNNIPPEIVKDIVLSSTTMLILEVKIKVRTRVVNLPPCVYFIDK